MGITTKEGPCPQAIRDKYDGLKPVEGHAITYGLCDLCSYPQLLEDAPTDDGSAKLDLVWINQHTCEKCAEMARSAPEIFLWVHNVVDTMMAARALDTPLDVDLDALTAGAQSPESHTLSQSEPSAHSDDPQSASPVAS